MIAVRCSVVDTVAQHTALNDVSLRLAATIGLQSPWEPPTAVGSEMQASKKREASFIIDFDLHDRRSAAEWSVLSAADTAKTWSGT